MTVNADTLATSDLGRPGVGAVDSPARRNAAKPIYFHTLRRDKFVEAVKLLGWSRVTLADRLGVSERQARRWLDGDAKAPLEAVRWLWAVWLAMKEVGEFPGKGVQTPGRPHQNPETMPQSPAAIVSAEGLMPNRARNASAIER